MDVPDSSVRILYYLYFVSAKSQLVSSTLDASEMQNKKPASIASQPKQENTVTGEGNLDYGESN